MEKFLFITVEYHDQLHFTIIQNYFVDFLVFSLVAAFFGRPLRASSSVLISLRLNLANHFSTVDFAGAESK
jgi:hypothetical protein